MERSLNKMLEASFKKNWDCAALSDFKGITLHYRDVARRIVDFISGAAYANHGNMRKVSRGTFLIVPNGVDMMGELMLEDFEEGSLYL